LKLFRETELINADIFFYYHKVTKFVQANIKEYTKDNTINTIMDKKVIVTGVIGADVHAVGNKILTYALEEAGFKMINLGVMVSQEEFIEAAVETNADAILVSSLYGHGEIDCYGLRDKCDEAGLKDIPLLAGGNLVVGKQDFEEVEKRFMAMGFTKVYPPNTQLDTTIADLNILFSK
jgi:methylaspartate mutase sigma subunit